MLRRKSKVFRQGLWTWACCVILAAILSTSWESPAGAQARGYFVASPPNSGHVPGSSPKPTKTKWVVVENAAKPQVSKESSESKPGAQELAAVTVAAGTVATQWTGVPMVQQTNPTSADDPAVPASSAASSVASSDETGRIAVLPLEEAPRPQEGRSAPALVQVARMQGQTPTRLPGESGLETPAPATQPASPAAAAPSQETQANPPSGPSVIPGLGNPPPHLQFIELRQFLNYSEVTGDAKDRTFLTPGYNNGMDISYLENFSWGIRQFEVASVGRFTDDPRVDPESSSLQRAYFRVSAPQYQLNLGDYLVSYTRFTYNQNLKGLNYIRTMPWGEGSRLLVNAGTFTDRYGSLFKDDIFGKPFTRVVSGARLEQKLSRDKLVAFNWSYGNDIVRSVPIDPLTGSEPFTPIKNNVVSLDSRMTLFRVWDMQGEMAYSVTNPDTRFFSFNRKDYAVRFDNTVRAGIWTFNEYYTRIMPSFYAVNARQIADLQDFLFRASAQLTGNVSLQGSYRRTNDDLREQNRNPQTTFQLPEARVSLRNLPHLGNTLVDLGYRERHQQQAGIADHVTRTPFFEIGIPISTSVLSFGFEHRANIDRIRRVNQTSANDFSASFRSVFDLGNWMFTPLLRYQHNRELFDRVPTGNNNRSIQATLIVDAPKYFVFEAMFREIGATLFQDAPQFDPVTFLPLTGPNGQQLFSVTGPSGFRRPAYHFAITYKLGNSEDRTFTLSYDRNINRFALPGQDFLERVIQATVVWRLRQNQ